MIPGGHYHECVSYARLRIRVVSQPFCVDQLNPAGFIVPNVFIRKTPALFLRGKLESRNKYGGRGFVADDIYFRGGVKGGTGSADPHNFSAKSTNPNFFKVKSESAKSSAENEQKSFSIRLFMLEFCSTMNWYNQH